MQWPAVRTWIQGHRALLTGLAVLLLAGLGFASAHALLAEVRFAEVRAAFAALGPAQIGACLALTAISYLALTGYDVVALRIIGRPLPWPTAALASFVSYTLSHNLGLGLITGGSARYRIYTGAGLSAADVARVVATAGLAFWAGVVVMAAAALCVHTVPLVLGPVTLPVAQQQLLGGMILMLAVMALFQLRQPGRALRLWRWRLPLPTTGLALTQLGVAALDLVAASAALWVLLPDPQAVSLTSLFLGYALAIVVAVISHVPGGMGIFEAVILATVPDAGKPGLFAALLAYRAIYYLLPLFIAAAIITWHEGQRLRAPIETAANLAQSIIGGLAPVLMAVLSFIGGSILLVSAALPPIESRLLLLKSLVPLPFVEASHIASSLVGTGLLLLAPALYRRLDAGFVLTRALLAAGILFSLAKGMDYEEAIVLGVVLLLLQWTRGAFYRRTSLTMAALSPGWMLAIGLAASLALTLGLFAYKHVEYANDLWWQFAWAGDASRFLRASFLMAIALIGVLVLRLYSPVAAAGSATTAFTPLDGAALALAQRSDAFLALTGDKRFLAATDGSAFLMYQVQGRSWIVMGDPVGKKAHWADLLWQIRDLADAAQGRLLLYQLSPEALPIAIDLGLQLVKYGEEARVDLLNFSLDGANAKALRYAVRRAERDGASFEIVKAADVPVLIPELRAVSEEWLAAKGQSEKAFSVGQFNTDYLARFDCAVVRNGGKITAFANVWATPGREELSIDLMRHARVTPYGTMDFLFVQLMQWGKAQGFAWFSLGLAPLSGIEARRLAPMWAKAAAFLYRHGEALYGFEGLRAYKSKYAPGWEPRFIAGPHGVGMAQALVDLQRLVGGSKASAARKYAHQNQNDAQVSAAFDLQM